MAKKRTGPNTKKKRDGETFFEATTVHGFRYLASKRTFDDRLTWTLVIFSGFAYAAYLIQSNLDDWEKNPGKKGPPNVLRRGKACRL